MKLKLIHSFTPEKYNTIKTINIIKTPKDNNYSQKNVFIPNKKQNKKHCQLKLNEKLNIFSFDEEYVSKLKYYSPELNLKGNKRETLYNIYTSKEIPAIFKKFHILDNKNFEENKKLISRINVKKQIFEKNDFDEMEHTRYVGRLENMYKENTLEKKRHELELKIKKIKSLINPLSKELSDTLSQIENSKIDLEILKNYKNYSLGKKFLPKGSKKNLNIFKNRRSINVNSENSFSEKGNIINKGKEKDKRMLKEIIKFRRQSIIEEKKLSSMEKLKLLYNKKNNILIKLDSCEKDLMEFKEKLNIIKNELLVHYHKLLLEGKDTRKDGLSWIIKSIWNLKSNVIMSFMPKFLDMNSISFLFLYSDKLAEIEKIQKKIEKINTEIKNRERKTKKLAHLCKMILKNNHREEYILHLITHNEKKHSKNNKNNKENNKNNENDISNNDNSKNKNIQKNKKIIDNNLPIIMDRENLLKKTKLKRLLSMPILSTDEITIQNKNIKKQKTINNNNLNANDTFKTSLYKDSSFSESSDISNDDPSKKVKNKIKRILSEPEYVEKYAPHLSPPKIIKVKDYENFKTFKIEDSFDAELLNLFNTHKEMIKKLKNMKNEADKLVRKELDRIGKCFYLEDYEAKYNTNIKIVIGALIGEDNIRNELLRQEKEQKDYFKTIKNIRNYNGFYYKKYI